MANAAQKEQREPDAARLITLAAAGAVLLAGGMVYYRKLRDGQAVAEEKPPQPIEPKKTWTADKSYMVRLADRETPIPHDAPMFLSRPLPPQPAAAADAKPGKKAKTAKAPRKRLDKAAKAKLVAAYEANVARPATRTVGPRGLPRHALVEVLPGKAWVVTDLLTAAECAMVQQKACAAGLQFSIPGVTRRTSSRTKDWMAADLSVFIKEKLSEELLRAVETSYPHTAVRGVHPNWRGARYVDGQTFPAHFDQSDLICVTRPDGGAHEKEYLTSSHTLLIGLNAASTFEGGATRLFPHGSSSYADSVDVKLPRGAALVFDQHVLHAGLPVPKGEKFIAQVGLLRGEPRPTQNLKRRQPPLFKWGPGLASY